VERVAEIESVLKTDIVLKPSGLDLGHPSQQMNLIWFGALW